MEHYDLVIIGSGPGGYVAAIRGAQLGYKTVLIEKYNTLGGTCTNVGCIPTKAILDSTHHYHEAVHHFATHGIMAKELSVDFGQLYTRKDKVVLQNTQGLNFLMRKNKVAVIHGTASFVDHTTLRVVKEDNGTDLIQGSNIIIATGSKPATIPGVVIDKKRVITSTEALSLKQQPKSLVIIGGGVIGVEMASIFNRLGTAITIIEYADHLLANMDHELGTGLRKILSNDGIRILLQQAVYKVENLGDTAKVSFKDRAGQIQEIEADYVLVAVGRSPYTEGLGLENTAVELDVRGAILTNDRLQTAVPNIYAIGDVIGGAMLAHKAEEEALFVVEQINGQKPKIHYDQIPAVVYTWPEVASVGFTEEELKAKGVNYTIGSFPFSANARARAGMDTQGFVKVLADTVYGELLGVHVLGARAADLIAQAVVGLAYEITADSMARISYAHPTYSEVMKEAHTIASGRPSINI